MKNILVGFLFLVSNFALSQNSNFDDWKEMAKSDISLQPKYGNVEKTKDQIKSDQEFISEILKHFKNKSDASKNLVDTGFKYLYEKGDFVTAMRRFNQAFILNEKNPDVFYGYGSVYFNLGGYNDARIQYDEGLKLNPNHSEILTDYGTTYLADYYSNNKIKTLELAKSFLEKSNTLDDKNSNTIYKLSIVYMFLRDCEKANNYLKTAKKMNNQNITKEFEDELAKNCGK